MMLRAWISGCEVLRLETISGIAQYDVVRTFAKLHSYETSSASTMQRTGSPLRPATWERAVSDSSTIEWLYIEHAGHPSKATYYFDKTEVLRKFICPDRLSISWMALNQVKVEQRIAGSKDVRFGL
ncbi:hypothetical protein e1012e08.tmp0311 [Eimeria tenella]|uniref:Uncharacterized protein n=1 Tax=Eimeria tenella TaxID=5802 RepID=C8TDM8_EIMTE|nr:hypothetical protein e1012e08.tmp0311 [Eimeria tenella]